MWKLATSCGTDPLTVLETWSPLRLRFALDCLGASLRARGEILNAKAAFPVVSVDG